MEVDNMSSEDPLSSIAPSIKKQETDKNFNFDINKYAVGSKPQSPLKSHQKKMVKTLKRKHMNSSQLSMMNISEIHKFKERCEKAQ
jgi:hypothetical protein